MGNCSKKVMPDVKSEPVENKKENCWKKNPPSSTSLATSIDEKIHIQSRQLETLPTIEMKPLVEERRKQSQSQSQAVRRRLSLTPRQFGNVYGNALEVVNQRRKSVIVKMKRSKTEANIVGENKSLVNDKGKLIKVLRRRLSITPNLVGNIYGTALGNIKTRKSVMKINRRKSEAHLDVSQQIKSGPCKGYSFVSITKKGYIPYNRGKINQDSLVSCEDIGRGIPLFGVLDGHGVNGAMVSEFVAQTLVEFAKIYVMNEEDDEVCGKDMLKTIIACAVNKLATQTRIDISFSGTTLTLSAIIDGIMYTANIGDSRLIAINVNDSSVTSKALSLDHKPENPEEMKRILERGGRVAPLPGPVGVDMGPQRVWLTDMDIPGLAMSRSIGDSIAHRVGVLDIPEITEFKITEDVLMFLWATDGVWEFIPNNEAANICVMALEDECLNNEEGETEPPDENDIPPIAQVAEKIVRESINRWALEEDAIDDCTALILVVNYFLYRKKITQERVKYYQN